MKRLFCLFLLLTSASAFAQQTSTETDPALEARIEQLESKSTKWDKFLSHLPKISGYMQLGYQWNDAGTSNFFIKRVRLDLKGNIVPKLDYRLQLEFKSPKIVDAFLQYRAFTQLNVKLGQYKIPFSIENTDYPPLKLELIDYPMALQKLMGFSEKIGNGSISATGREMGASLWGGFFKRDGYCILNYDFGVFNGAGINATDNNKSKDIAARLTIKPAKGLTLSGSYYWGEYGSSYFKRERYGAGVCYDRGPLVVRGEWIGGETGMASNGVAGNLKSSGWYAMAGWRATKTLMPVARYDTFLENTKNDSSRQTNYTLGLLWQPVKHLRCQINYTFEDYKYKDNCNGISVMFTGMF